MAKPKPQPLAGQAVIYDHKIHVALDILRSIAPSPVDPMAADSSVGKLRAQAADYLSAYLKSDTTVKGTK